jgi:hypothetical protein
MTAGSSPADYPASACHKHKEPMTIMSMEAKQVRIAGKRFFTRKVLGIAIVLPRWTQRRSEVKKID